MNGELAVAIFYQSFHFVDLLCFPANKSAQGIQAQGVSEALIQTPQEKDKMPSAPKISVRQTLLKWKVDFAGLLGLTSL